MCHSLYLRPEGKEQFPMQGNTKEKDNLQSARLMQGRNGQGDTIAI